MLKNKSMSYCLLLTIMLLIGSAMTSYAGQMAGGFNEMEDGSIVGWGWDSGTPNTAIPVHVTVTNQETSEIVGDFQPTAAVYRDDLYEKGIGNGRHGFLIQMNWDSLSDGTYLIEGWVEDQKMENSLTYAKGEAQQTLAAEAENASADESTSGLRSLGVFRTTGYCPCRQCSEGWGRHTCTGAIAQSGHTIAVDPRVIPYGSKVMINGVVYTAEDRGGGVRGNHIDIFFDNHAQTRQHGNQALEVFLVS